MARTATKKTKERAKTETRELLIPADMYLSAGVHIGMKQKVKAMEKYIYKIRPDRLAVFNIEMIDQQIREAAKMIAKHDPKDVLVVGRKVSSHKAVAKFAEAIGGALYVYGRFYPGSLTNPLLETYMEPRILIATDPQSDRQAISEAKKSNIPVIAICDSFNDPTGIDLVISANNKGRKSIALIYWLLAREVLKARGEIKGNAEYRYKPEDFEMPVRPQK